MMRHYMFMRQGLSIIVSVLTGHLSLRFKLYIGTLGFGRVHLCECSAECDDLELLFQFLDL